jgi:hypothetical protein
MSDDAIPGSPGYNGTPSDAEGGAPDFDNLLADSDAEPVSPFLAKVIMDEDTGSFVTMPPILPASPAPPPMHPVLDDPDAPIEFAPPVLPDDATDDELASTPNLIVKRPAAVVALRSV